jgi:tRNA(adenine34) deaminase
MDDVEAMRVALEEAELAEEAGDVPVGAVILREDRIVARAHNEREQRRDPTAHAELLAISAAVRDIGAAGLESSTLVVSLEPCVMCAGGIVAAKLARVVFAAFDEKAGACGSRYNLLSDPRLGIEIPVTTDVLAEEATEQLRAFFASRRTDRDGRAGT